MKLAIVHQVNNEPEARMLEDLLKQSGVYAEVKLDPSIEALRHRAGGANLPFEQWDIMVDESKADEAKVLLSTKKP